MGVTALHAEPPKAKKIVSPLRGSLLRRDY
jgi:hypothetical protein